MQIVLFKNAQLYGDSRRQSPAIKRWLTLSSEIDSQETIIRSGDFPLKSEIAVKKIIVAHVCNYKAKRPHAIFCRATV